MSVVDSNKLIREGQMKQSKLVEDMIWKLSWAIYALRNVYREAVEEVPDNDLLMKKMYSLNGNIEFTLREVRKISSGNLFIDIPMVKIADRINLYSPDFPDRLALRDAVMGLFPIADTNDMSRLMNKLRNIYILNSKSDPNEKSAEKRFVRDLIHDGVAEFRVSDEGRIRRCLLKDHIGFTSHEFGCDRKMVQLVDMRFIGRGK